MKKLLEKRAKLYAAMQELRKKYDDEKGWDSEESRQNWEKLNADYDANSAEIKRSEEKAALNSRMATLDEEQRGAGNAPMTPQPGGGENRGGAGGPSAETRSLAFQGWCSRYSGNLTDEMRSAMQECRCPGPGEGVDINLPTTRQYNEARAAAANGHQSLYSGAVQRALTTGTATSGGNLIPEGFVPQLEAAMLAFGPMLQVADVIQTDSGNDLPWPTANDTGNSGVLLAESASVATDADPTFGALTLNAYKLTSKEVLVPQELMEDSGFGLESILPGMLGERLGRGVNTYATTGTGSSQPGGIVTDATTGVTAASTTAIVADDIIKLEHSVDAAYRQGAAYMMSDAVCLLARLLKDGDSNYLWRPGLAEGRPDTLNARPVHINGDMDASLAAGDTAMLFGNFKTFKIRRVRAVRLYHLKELHRANDQDGFVAFLRFDSGQLDAGTHPVKSYDMAAS